MYALLAIDKRCLTHNELQEEGGGGVYIKGNGSEEVSMK